MTRTAAAPVRSRDGWFAAALVGVAFAVTMLGTTLPTPLYPRYAALFGFGEVLTTVIYAVYAGGVVAGLLLFGHWSDQIGRRPMLLAALVLSALSAGAYLLPSELGWLFVGRVLSGLSAGICTGTATATVVDLAPEGGQKRAGLVAAAVNMGGLGLGPLLAGVLAQYAPHPLRLCFLVDLALIALGMVAVLLVRETVDRAAEPTLRPRALRVPSDLRAVFTRAAIAAFAGFATLGLFTAVSPAFLGQVLMHRNAALVGVLVLVVFASSVLGQALVGLAGSRAMPLGCATLIAGMVVVAAALATKSLAVLVVGTVLSGAGQGLSFRAALGELTVATPADARGEVTSTFFVVAYVGISLPVIGEGVLAAGTSLVSAGVTFAVLVAALAAVALMLLARSSRVSPPRPGG